MKKKKAKQILKIPLLFLYPTLWVYPRGRGYVTLCNMDLCTHPSLLQYGWQMKTISVSYTILLNTQLSLLSVFFFWLTMVGGVGPQSNGESVISQGHNSSDFFQCIGPYRNNPYLSFDLLGTKVLWKMIPLSTDFWLY